MSFILARRLFARYMWCLRLWRRRGGRATLAAGAHALLHCQELLLLLIIEQGRDLAVQVFTHVFHFSAPPLCEVYVVSPIMAEARGAGHSRRRGACAAALPGTSAFADH